MVVRNPLCIINGRCAELPSGDTVSGAGSVTSVSVATANGVSGTVSNPSTTPQISLSLGNITPTSVAASGTVTGSNLSGTNTGDQNVINSIAVSGEDTVTTSGNQQITLVAGTNTTITTNNATKSITINSTGSSGVSLSQVLTIQFLRF